MFWDLKPSWWTGRSAYKCESPRKSILFNGLTKFRRGDAELLFEATIEKTGVIKPRNVGDVCDGIGGGKEQVFCVIQPLIQKIFGDGLPHVFFEGVALRRWSRHFPLSKEKSSS